MPDIVDVSDSILRFANKTRLFSDSITVSEAVDRVTAKAVIKSLSDTVGVSEAIALEQSKQRIISESITVADAIAAYKNDILIEPAVEVLHPSSLISGQRERRIRIPRRAPRPIVIDEISNVAIVPLKLLARLDNKAIVGIRPRPSLNVASADLMAKLASHKSIAQSAIKTQLQPITVKARLALLSLPLSGLGEARLKTRPETQYIESFKAINADRIDKLTKLMNIILLAENL